MIKEKDKDKLQALLKNITKEEKNVKFKAFSSFFESIKELEVTYIMSKKRRNLVDYIVYGGKKIKLIWFNNNVYLDYGNGTREHSRSFINRVLTQKNNKEKCVD